MSSSNTSTLHDADFVYVDVKNETEKENEILQEIINELYGASINYDDMLVEEDG